MKKLLKAAAKTGMGTIATLFFGILCTKIIAVFLGASGIGLFSLLRQARLTAVTLATVSGNTALVQGVASLQANERKAYIGTVFWIFLMAGAVTCCGLFYFAPLLAETILGKKDSTTISLIQWLPLPVFLGVLLAFYTGLLNGYRAIGQLALVNTSAAFALALLTYPTALIVRSGNETAFIWMMTGSVFTAIIVSVYYLWKGGWHKALWDGILCGISTIAAQHFLKIAMTTLFTGLTTTGTLLVVRSLITREHGLEGAGLFDVSWTLSMMYVSLITQSFTTYYLPTLSSIKSPQERVHLMQQLFRLSTLLMIPMATAVVVLKPLVIHLLYSNDFIESLQTIRWMLIGDYLKITSWVVAIPILAFADMRTYFWSELLWNIFFIIGAFFSVVHWGNIEGIGITFLAVYAAYLIFMMSYCRYRHKFTITQSMAWHWIAGLSLILAASLYTWKTTHIEWGSALIWIAAACSLSWLGLSKAEKTKLLQIGFR